MCEYTDANTSIDYDIWCMLKAAIWQKGRWQWEMFTLWHLSGSLSPRLWKHLLVRGVVQWGRRATQIRTDVYAEEHKWLPQWMWNWNYTVTVNLCAVQWMTDTQSGLHVYKTRFRTAGSCSGKLRYTEGTACKHSKNVKLGWTGFNCQPTSTQLCTGTRFVVLVHVNDHVCYGCLSYSSHGLWPLKTWTGVHMVVADISIISFILRAMVATIDPIKKTISQVTALVMCFDY